MQPQYSSYRWLVLLSYALTGLLSQLVWLTFAPILSTTAQTFNVSTADVGNLSLVFPLIYIIVSIPTGYFIDSYGFRKAVLLGTGFLAVFGLLRAFSPNFAFLLIFQALAAIGQPFIMNSISKLVKGWFPEKEFGLATGLGSLSLFVGMIAGLVFTPLLMESFQLYSVLLIYGVFSLLILGVFFFLGKESSKKVTEKEAVTFSEFLKVFKNRNIVLLSAMFFVGIGVFTAFTTWIEPIMNAQNVNIESAGLLGGLMIIGGIIGAIVIPGLSDRYKIHKKALTISFLISAILWYILTILYGPTLVGLAIFPLGFFFMVTLPLSLELSAESVEKKYLGIANSILYEFSQIGSLLLIIVFELAAGIYSWQAALVISSILTVVAVLLSMFLKKKVADKQK
jgi:predicted MFS family arabinose efflux permease